MNFDGLHFLDAVVDYGPAYVVHYNAGLDIISYLIAAIASSAAMIMGDYVRCSPHGHLRSLWLLAGTVVMGTGIWAMHLTGMLAAEFPVPVAYDAMFIVASAVPALLAGFVCLAVISRDEFGAWNVIFGGVAVALGSAATHYLCIAALQVSADVRHDQVILVLSIVVAVVLAMSAMYVFGRATKSRVTTRTGSLLVSGAIMGLGVTIMHIEAVQAVYFFPVEAVSAAVLGSQPMQTAAFVTVVTISVLGLGVPAAVLATRLKAEASLLQAHDDLEDRVRRRTAQLERSRVRLLEAQRIAKVGSWELELATNEISWSVETYRLLGEDPGTFKVTYESFIEKVHPDDRTIVGELRDVARGSRGPINAEHRVVLPDGRTRNVRTRVELERDAAGRPVRLVGTSVDVTERVEADKLLRESEAKYRMIADAAQEGICVEDVDSKITYVNRRMAEMLGYTREELLGRFIHEVLGEDSRKEVDSRMSKRRTGASDHYDVPMRHKDGSQVWVSVAATPVTDDKGQFAGSLAMVSDITSRRKLEEELRQAQRMEAVGQLTGGIAHDFNNLLTVIIGNLQLLEEEVKEYDAAAGPIADALNAGHRGADLTKRLLAFSRRQLLSPKVTAVNRLVIDIEPLLRRALGAHVTLTTVNTDDLWLIEVDPSQLENAVVNLCINARDAMPEGGGLTIKTSNSILDDSYVAKNPEVIAGEYVLLTVNDNGTGMKEEVMQHIFEPFFTTKEAGKGSGLGLSMVYGFVKQSNGHIDIESEEGRGTTVRIYLPRSHATTELTGATSTSRVGIPNGDETILAVEDDVAVRKIAVEFLTALGYRVLEAGTGEEALAVLGDHEDIDLVFSDIVMPGGMTGIELARHVHRHYPKLKVLLTSGYADTAAFDEEYLQRGGEVLKKPYQKAGLARTVRDILDQE